MTFTLNLSTISVTSSILAFGCIMLLSIQLLLSLKAKIQFITIPVVLVIVGWLAYSFFFAGTRFSILFLVAVGIFIAVLLYLPNFLDNRALDASAFAILALFFGCAVSFMPVGSQPLSRAIANSGINLTLPTFNVQGPGFEMPSFQFGSGGSRELNLPNNRVEMTGIWNELEFDGVSYVANLPSNTSQFLRLEDNTGQSVSIYFSGGQQYGSFNVFLNNDLRQTVTAPVAPGEYVITTPVPQGEWVLVIVPVTNESVAISRIVVQRETE